MSIDLWYDLFGDRKRQCLIHQFDDFAVNLQITIRTNKTNLKLPAIEEELLVRTVAEIQHVRWKKLQKRIVLNISENKSKERNTSEIEHLQVVEQANHIRNLFNLVCAKL
jgi:hypothetical protein